MRNTRIALVLSLVLAFASYAEGAITFVGSAVASAIDGADATIDLTAIAGLAQNDLVIVAYAIGDSDNLNQNLAMVTSGYTEISDQFNDGVFETNLGVYWKVMGSTPDTSAVVDGLGGTNAAVAAVAMAFRGVDTTTPFDVAGVVGGANTSIHPNPSSIDHNNPSGVWTVFAVASGHDLGAAGSYTYPTGYTTNARTTGSNDTNDVTIGMAYNTSPADPENPPSFNHSGTDTTNYSNSSFIMALRPAVAASTAGGGMLLKGAGR